MWGEQMAMDAGCLLPPTLPMTVTAAALPRSLLDLTTGELTAWLKAEGFKATHAERVLRRVYGLSPQAGRCGQARCCPADWRND